MHKKESPKPTAGAVAPKQRVAEKRPYLDADEFIKKPRRAESPSAEITATSGDRVDESSSKKLPLRDVSNVVSSKGERNKAAKTLSQGSQNSSNTAGSAGKKQGLVDWSCGLCTYLNGKRSSKCAMCGYRK